MRKPIASSWKTTRRLRVESKPCVLLHLDEADSIQFREFRLGFNKFATASSGSRTKQAAT